MEAELQEDDRECAEEILKNTGFIADYLDSMRQVLKGEKEQKMLAGRFSRRIVRGNLRFCKAACSSSKNTAIL